jgi:alpha-methylacyl-CoA racemase
MVDGAASLMSVFNGLRAAGAWSDRRGENLLDGGAPFYGVYETADGRHVALGPLEPKFFAELAQRIGLPERYVRGQHDRRLWPEMREAIAALVRARTRDEWCAQLEGTDACFAPVLTLDEAPAHPHAQARGSYLQVDGVTQPAPAPRFDRSVPEAPRPAPETGAHTAQVLAEAGFGADEIAALRAAGVAA